MGQHSKRATLIQCWVNIGPAAQTLRQHCSHIAPSLWCEAGSNPLGSGSNHLQRGEQETLIQCWFIVQQTL